MTDANYKKLESIFSDLHNVTSISSILNWDAATLMPINSSDSRAEQLAYLQTLGQHIVTTHNVPQICNDVKIDDPWALANMREMERIYHDYRSVSSNLLKQHSILSNKCEMKWREARASSDYSIVRDIFQQLIDATRDVAAQKSGYFKTSPYQTLVDQYDPQRKVSQIEVEFAKLEQFLPSFINQVIESQEDYNPPVQHFDIEKQKEISRELIEILGFDINSGRIDESTHPFCGGHSEDVRITTRYSSENLVGSIYGTIHETGHALYEQNLPKKWIKQPVGSSWGMSTHESQSLFMENQVGQSDAFLKFLHKKIGNLFNITEKDLKLQIKKVKKSFIRVEADEVTYPLHVILRFHIERDIIDGKINAKDLPEIWNGYYKKYLGITPPSDALGCLQDIHWYSGTFGYFPSYTLGAMLAAQLMHAMKSEIKNVDSLIEAGKFEEIKSWLSKNIHSKGRLVEQDQLVKDVTGDYLHSDYFINHLKERYG